MPIEDKAAVIEQVSELLANDRVAEAAERLDAAYPFQPVEKTKWSLTRRQMTKIFVRDGFIDLYRGTRLVFPPALRLISIAMPEQFPYHKNGKMAVGHFAYWELFPSVDHVRPVARGGEHNESNWVCCSMLANQIKANWTLEELGWELRPPGDFAVWDGLLNWFVTQMAKDHVRATAPPYCHSWLAPAKEFARR